MPLPSLSQWWGKRPAPVQQGRTQEPARSGPDQTGDPFQALHREMTRAFDDFWRAFETAPFGPSAPGPFGLPDGDSFPRAEA